PAVTLRVTPAAEPCGWAMPSPFRDLRCLAMIFSSVEFIPAPPSTWLLGSLDGPSFDQWPLEKLGLLSWLCIDAFQQRSEEIPMNGPPKAVLVPGAPGYIGGRLVPRLLEAGHTVKVVVRTPAKIAGVPWLAQVEVVSGSLDDGAVLRAALDGVDVLYYLVHSMAAGAGFEAKEKAMAETAAKAAADAGVARIVYLGGLHPEGAELSTHMRSREAV